MHKLNYLSLSTFDVILVGSDLVLKNMCMYIRNLQQKYNTQNYYFFFGNLI